MTLNKLIISKGIGTKPVTKEWVSIKKIASQMPNCKEANLMILKISVISE